MSQDEAPAREQSFDDALKSFVAAARLAGGAERRFREEHELRVAAEKRVALLTAAFCRTTPDLPV